MVTTAAPTPTSAWALRIGMVMVVAAGLIAWIAVGRLDDAVSSEGASTRVALSQSEQLAASSAIVADQLHQSVVALHSGVGSASEAIGYVVTISENVRKALDIVASLGNVDAIRNTLGDTEASLDETQGGLDETGQALADAEPKVAAALTALQAVPAQLKAVQSRLDQQRSSTDVGIVLWRTAVMLAAAAVLVLLLVVERLVRSTLPRSSCDSGPL